MNFAGLQLNMLVLLIGVLDKAPKMILMSAGVGWGKRRNNSLRISL